MYLARRPSDTWIIDFGWTMSGAEAAYFAEPFAHALTRVGPGREKNNRETYRRLWWRHVETRPGHACKARSFEPLHRDSNAAVTLRPVGRYAACSGVVEVLTDGVFTLTGPMGAGNPGNVGDTALVDIQGVRVMITSRKMQALDQAILRHVGIEPAECPIIALKSSVHFRADFGPLAERVIVAIAPGPVVADPAVLNFRHVRAEVRRRPRTVGVR